MNVTLTPRETEVIQAIIRGEPFKAIAADMRITVRGVKFHTQRIYAKFQVHSAAAAVAVYFQKDLYQRPAIPAPKDMTPLHRRDCPTRQGVGRAATSSGKLPSL